MIRRIVLCSRGLRIHCRPLRSPVNLLCSTSRLLNHDRHPHPLRTTAGFSTLANEAPYHQHRNETVRWPWIDTNRSLKSRVTSFLEADIIPPRVFHAKSTEELVKECCQENSLKGMQWADDILDRLLVEKRRLWVQKSKMVVVPEDLLSVIMYGWAVKAADEKVASRRMKELLNLAVEEALEDTRVYGEMLSRSPQDSSDLEENDGSLPSVPLASEPTVQIFNTYLDGLKIGAKAFPGLILESEATLEQMVRCREQYHWHTKPNTRSFTLVITALGNSERRDAGAKSLAILQAMKEIYQAEKKQYYIDTGAEYEKVTRPKRQIVTPDLHVYTSVIAALVGHKNTFTQGLELFKELLDQDDIVLDEGIFAVVLHGFSVFVDREKYAPHRLSAARDAENLLWEMVERLYPDTEDGRDLLARNVEGCRRAFNACINVWSKSFVAEAAPKCEELLQDMLSGKFVLPDVVSFNSCLHAWSRSSRFFPDAGKRAEALLNFQLELCADDSLPKEAWPDFMSYSIVISAISESDDEDKAFRARSVLEGMVQNVKDRKIHFAMSPVAPFSGVLSAVAKSRTKDSNTVDDEVDGFTSRVDTSSDPFAVAEKTYREIQEDSHGIGVAPDHFVYGAFLKCLARHTRPGSSERESKTRIVFDDACEAGQVSRVVVDGLRAVGGKMLMIPELQEGNKLPLFWTRNVPRRFRYSGRKSR